MKLTLHYEIDSDTGSVLVYALTDNGVTLVSVYSTDEIEVMA